MFKSKAPNRGGDIQALGPEGYRTLVDALYAPVVSTVGPQLLAPVTGALAYWVTGDLLYLGMAAALVVIGVARIANLVAYFRLARAGGPDDRALESWERRFGIGAGVFALAIGGMAFHVAAFSGNASLTLVLSVGAVGYAAGIAGRNAAIPRVAIPQMLAAVLPLVAGLFLHGGLVHVTLAAMLLVFFASIYEASTRLGRFVVDAMAAKREVTGLHETLRQATMGMVHGFIMFDAKGRIAVSNARFGEVFGLSRDSQVVGMGPRDLLSACVAQGVLCREQADLLVPLMALRMSGRGHDEHLVRTRNGRAIGLNYRPVEGGGCVVTAEDVTRRKAVEDSTLALVRKDALTGLLNRVGIEESLSGWLSRGEPTAVLCLDLDRFKRVNDTFGHGVGDELLQAVAGRISAVIRPGDLAGRIGGDEFVVLLREAGDGRTAEEVAARIVESLGKPFEIAGHRVATGTSVGIAHGPRDAASGERLMRYADLALYKAKAGGRGHHCVYSRTLSDQAEGRRRLGEHLRAALSAGALSVHYQPQVEAASGRTVAREALLRWERDGVPVPASDFIAVAEETGCIAEIGRWVLETACAEALGWDDGMRVCVNLSRAQFAKDDAAALVAGALARSGLAPGRLEVEVCESTLMDDAGPTRAALLALKQAGVRVVLDDFGAGAASLSLLAEFPFDKVKVDRGLGGSDEGGPGRRAVFRCVTRLAADLGIEVVASGVETGEDADWVTTAGCRLVQGHHYGRPEPVVPQRPRLSLVAPVQAA